MELSLKDIKELLCVGSSDPSPFAIGKSYFIRTVTMYFTGRLVAVYPQELVFEEAAWIADTGRFSKSLKDGEFKEVEPFADRVIVGRGALIDASEFNKKLPREIK